VKHNWRPWAAAAFVTALSLASAADQPAHAQGSDNGAARALLARMSPAERVGQLFLVPFWGADVGDGSPVARLIVTHHVGGVLLDPTHGNFTNTPDTPRAVAALTAALQARAAGGDGPRAPLFIALAQLGDGFPDSGLWGGMTPLPSQMALGATWRPDFAEQIGALVGRELDAVGVNLLLAPTLDVSNDPRPGSSGDLGVRTFGGSPPWVGRFGQAYIAGVHAGSRGRIATVAGNFPGIGGADRSQAEELPIVESTLPDLAEVELVPFAAVTGQQAPERARTDALLTSHVRYRGLQQQTDRPFSLDSGGLRYVWAQIPALTSWRDGLGVLVSPGLGAPAVRRYLDPASGSLNARRVVREALAAGNDVLVLTDFGPNGDPEAQTASIEDAIGWLATEYSADNALREAVDAAALRVLTLKARLAPLDGPTATADAGAITQVGGGADTVSQVARAALTQITPSGDQGTRPVAVSPQPGERLLFVVDARTVQECPHCAPYQSLDAERLLASLRRAYGPAGTGRLRADTDAAAITYADLKAWLQATGRVRTEDTVAFVPPLSAARLAEVGRRLRRANWLVFAMRDVRPQEDAASDALKLFLRATPPELANRHLVALAFGAPYYLDATETAKLTAYYAVYARTDPFVDVAIRALFGDEAATGASPVPVPGARYDLVKALEPTLSQIPGLELVGQDPQTALKQGAIFTVRTTTVRDGNGHPVPDGTRVRFRRYDRADGVFLPDIDAVTEDGRASGAMRADRAAVLEVSAAFDNGLRSEPVVVRIDEAGPFAFMQPPTFDLVRPRVAVDWGIFFLSLGLMLVAGVSVYAVDGAAARSPAHLVRLFLLSLCWGLAGYLLVAAGGRHLGALPGGLRLWPAGWSVAYQAPLLSLLLALLPVLWSLRYRVPTVAVPWR
jgi:beta-N-acetylhexosaminidase